MTRLLLTLLLLAGCAAPRVVLVRTPTVRGTGYVAPCCGAVVTVPHVVPGNTVEIVTRWGRVRARVLRRVGEEWVALRPERDLRHGDSGSPALVCGAWVGSVESRLGGDK